MATAEPCGAGRRTSPLVRGRTWTEVWRRSPADGRGGGLAPYSSFRMVENRSGPHLGSPTPAAQHVLPGSAPPSRARGSGTLGLPLNRDGCALVPTTQETPAQVDMTMAQKRMNVTDMYSKSYLRFLQAVLVAGSKWLLCVKDVSHLLTQDIAFLSGGRGKDNAWIITFPENCNFRYIPEEVIAEVLNYLLSVVRQIGSESPFTIILDRRLDTWSSVKISLQKIAASFHGNLQLVLVLRPTSFLQRSFTDIGFRFTQEDCTFKLPVVLLSSVSDLETYIDDKQLTPELGGTLHFCLSEWIIFRNAIESFALTVKETAQTLQSFGTELAETALPDDVTSVEEINAVHAERYHLLKNDITAVTKEGKILLANMELPAAEGAVSSGLQCHQQISNEWQTVNKLLTQVHDMEVAFDGFWEKHQLKMEQYLQLWKSEQGFQELVSDTELLLNQQAELADVTGNIAQNKVQTTRFKLRHIRSILEIQLAGFSTLNSKPVRPVQFVVPASAKAISHKSPFLSPRPGKKTWRQNQSNLKSEVVHDCREKKSSDQSSSLKSGNRMDVLKKCVLNELIETEKVYVRDLFTVLLGYRAEMDNPEMFKLMPPLLRNKKDILFGNMAEIHEFHNTFFMSSLENCIDSPERVGSCFLEWVSSFIIEKYVNMDNQDSSSFYKNRFRDKKDDFQIYAKYCLNKPRSEAIWRKYSGCAFFQECQRKLKHRLGLDSYLLKPVQRITKYQLLLKELLKYSKGCEGFEQLKEALDSMLDLLKFINDSMYQSAINGYIGDLNELGKMVTQGEFTVWIGHRKGATKMKDIARFKPKQRHLFLYEKAIVFCKRRVENRDDFDRYPYYDFKHSLKMDEVGVTEYIKGDNRKFEICYPGKGEVYIVQAPTLDVKMIWLKEIRSILLKQQELMTSKLKHAFFRTGTEQEQFNQLTESDQLSSQQNDVRQKEAFISAKETGSEHSCTGEQVDEAVVSVQAEVSSVCAAEIAEGPEEWSDKSFYSSSVDSEEERPLMSPGKYKALADFRKRESEDLLIRIGDMVQLLHEDTEGQWLVKNLNTKKEGLIPGSSLKNVVGEYTFQNTKVTDAALSDTRTLSFP